MRVKGDEFGVALDAQGIPPGTSIMCDEEGLRRVLLNLVSNALKFTPAKGSVFLEYARLPTGEDRLTVRDTGIGIPKDKIETLFQKFSMVLETRNKVRDSKGTGLGLVICKQIVEAQGGRIWVESVYNEGTSFHFTFPA